MLRQVRRFFFRNRDAWFLLAPVALFLAAAMLVDAGSRLHRIIDAHTGWHVDQIIVAMMGASIVFFGLLLMRTRRLRLELTLRRKAERKARLLALNDSLTGLPNRRSFLEQAEARAASLGADTAVSVLAIDLERFKPVNEIYGHEGGDTVLRVVAKRLQAAAGPEAVVARLGGGEFACLLVHAPDAAAPLEVSDAMLSLLARPIQLTGGLAEIGASIGRITCPAGARSPEEMLRAADFAVQCAKREGYSHSCAFVPEMEESMRARAQLELDMHAGITRGEFVPHFQPIVELETGRVSGFEALARWSHPTRGQIPPDLFIPIAEDGGMIQELSLVLLRRACCEARRWPKHLTLSVNISPLQLNDPWLAQRLLQILCASGFPPGRLIVEITESRLVQDIDAARAILLSLKSAGIQIALDDFGTGYASLKHLRELAFDRIKIDRNFVQDVDCAENSQIVRAILNLSEGLGLPVTAEGVETTVSAEWLAALGCRYGQGFLYSRPVTPEQALQIANGKDYPAPQERSGLPPHARGLLRSVG